MFRSTVARKILATGAVAGALVAGGGASAFAASGSTVDTVDSPLGDVAVGAGETVESEVRLDDVSGDVPAMEFLGEADPSIQGRARVCGLHYVEGTMSAQGYTLAYTNCAATSIRLKQTYLISAENGACKAIAPEGAQDFYIYLPNLFDGIKGC